MSIPSNKKNNDTTYDIVILAGLAITGLIVKLAFKQKTSESGLEGPANASVWGYGIMVISLLGLLFVRFSLANKESINLSSYELFKTLLTSSVPVLFIIMLLIWLILMNITHKEQINKGYVSKDYEKFGFISIALLVLQIGLLFKTFYSQSRSNSTTNGLTSESVLSKMLILMNSQLITLTYLIGIINMIIIGFMQVMLEYLSTDG
jgi:hypothetical protein